MRTPSTAMKAAMARATTPSTQGTPARAPANEATTPRVT
jgi:hypothetical protein